MPLHEKKCFSAYPSFIYHPKASVGPAGRYWEALVHMPAFSLFENREVGFSSINISPNSVHPPPLNTFNVPQQSYN